MNILDTFFLMCAPFVHVDTMNSLIATESDYNPYAIAIVNGEQLKSQPISKEDAILIIKNLDEQNINYSVGLGQINKSNFNKYNVTGQDLLDPCLNISIAQDILKTCYENSPNSTVKEALSCYYSGNYHSGFQIEKTGNSYIDRIISNIDKKPIVKSIKKELNTHKKDNPNINKNILIKSISNNIKTKS